MSAKYIIDKSYEALNKDHPEINGMVSAHNANGPFSSQNFEQKIHQFDKTLLLIESSDNNVPAAGGFTVRKEHLGNKPVYQTNKTIWETDKDGKRIRDEDGNEIVKHAKGSWLKGEATEGKYSYYDTNRELQTVDVGTKVTYEDTDDHARGFYQFKPSEFHTAKNRAKNWYKRVNGIPYATALNAAQKEHMREHLTWLDWDDRKFSELSKDKQREVMLINIFEAQGTDELILKYMKDPSADNWVQLYLKGHYKGKGGVDDEMIKKTMKDAGDPHA